jgi:alkylation response protein AidB-like acyl-CoA dehydrogenase
MISPGAAGATVAMPGPRQAYAILINVRQARARASDARRITVSHVVSVMACDQVEPMTEEATQVTGAYGYGNDRG